MVALCPLDDRARVFRLFIVDSKDSHIQVIKTQSYAAIVSEILRIYLHFILQNWDDVGIRNPFQLTAYLSYIIIVADVIATHWARVSVAIVRKK